MVLVRSNVSCYFLIALKNVHIPLQDHDQQENILWHCLFKFVFRSRPSLSSTSSILHRFGSLSRFKSYSARISTITFVYFVVNDMNILFEVIDWKDLSLLSIRYGIFNLGTAGYIQTFFLVVWLSLNPLKYIIIVKNELKIIPTSTFKKKNIAPLLGVHLLRPLSNQRICH